MKRDAVSRSFMLKLELLERLRQQGLPVKVIGFTQVSDIDHSAIRVTPDLMSLLRDPDFETADVHVFEYAMRYELFHALFLVRRPAIVIDHNTTPAQFVVSDETKAACARTRLERPNLALATRVVTDGEFTRDELLAMGLDPERLSVLHLPPTNSFVGRSEHTFDIRARNGIVRLLYVGRMVRAKGIHDLLDAVEDLWTRGVDTFTLTLAGSLRYSEPDTVALIRQAVARFGPEGKIILVVDADDEEIASLFGECDALVMPSYHEGYCIPVVEAMTSGCFVVGSDAGNLPVVMGGLGSIFGAGDVKALRGAIEEFVSAVMDPKGSEPLVILPTSSGPMTLPDWHQAVADHLLDYSLENYEREFLRILDETVAESAQYRTNWRRSLSASAGTVVTRSL